MKYSRHHNTFFFSNMGDFTFSPLTIPPPFGESVFIEKMWDFSLYLGLTQKQGEEIILNTRDPHDIALRRFTGDRERFHDTVALEKWYNYPWRLTFTLINEKDMLAGIWWWRPSDAPTIIRPVSDDIREALCSGEHSIHTSGIRIYPFARSQWLASPFVARCTCYYRMVHPHSCIFVDVDIENIPSQKLYKGLGYMFIGYGESRTSVTPWPQEPRMVFVDVSTDETIEA